MGHLRQDGSIRRSQVLTTAGPGAMVDLVNDAVIIKGPDAWSYHSDEVGFIDERRLQRKVLRALQKTNHWKRNHVRLRQPPEGKEEDPQRYRGIHAREFPRWYICQRCNSVVQREALTDKREHHCTDSDTTKSKAAPTVPVRFVAACKNGHLRDIDWRAFVHHGQFDATVEKPYRCQRNPELTLFEAADGEQYRADLQLRTEGTSGELDDLVMTCRRCGVRRGLQELVQPNALGVCRGWRPWLKTNDNHCDQDAQLLVRTGSNAWFPLIYSVLSIPDPYTNERDAVDQFWHLFGKIDTLPKLEFACENVFPDDVVDALKNFDLADVLTAIQRKRAGDTGEGVPIREAEWQVIMDAEYGAAHDLPPKEKKWFAHRLDGVELPPFIDRVVLVKTLTEVRAQMGFLRLEGFPMDAEGDIEIEAERVAPLSEEKDWVPAVEIRGEGLFIAFDETKIREWEARPEVQAREEQFREGSRMEANRKGFSAPSATNARLVMLHSLAHMLIRAISLECGYSAASIRERIYCYREPVGDNPTAEEVAASVAKSRAGILLYTGTPGSEGTLGGLVEVGKNIVEHLARAVAMNELCSNDPVCAQHRPDGPEEGRRREGAACHGCLLIAEPSCERMNRDLDRALVVPTVAEGSARMAFLGNWGQ